MNHTAWTTGVEKASSSGGAPGAMRGKLWRLWPWAAWLLALFLPFHTLLYGGGWAQGLVLISPVLVPLVVLLELLPRFVLRRKGHTTLPTAVARLLPFHWALMFLAIFSMNGPTESAPLPSALSIVAGGAVSAAVEQGFLAVCGLGALATGVALLALSLALRPRRDFARQANSSMTASITALAIVISAPLLAPAITALVPDEDGISLRDAQSLAPQEQFALAEERYQASQAELSQVRGRLSSGEWEFIGVRVGGTTSSEPQYYDFEISFTSVDKVALADADVTALLLDVGYEQTGSHWVKRSGQQLALNEVDGRIRVTLTSPWWWGDGAWLRDTIHAHATALQAATYRADSFPALTAVPASAVIKEWTGVYPSGSRYAPYNYPPLDEAERDGSGDSRETVLALPPDARDNAELERAQNARTAFDDFVRHLGGDASGVTETGAISADGTQRVNRHAAAAQYHFVRQETLNVPPLDWDALAQKLRDEGCTDVIVTPGAVAAILPDGTVLVAYDSPEGIIAGLRTPTWWG